MRPDIALSYRVIAIIAIAKMRPVIGALSYRVVAP